MQKTENSYYKEGIKSRLHHKATILMRQVGEGWGENPDFLEEYIEEQLETHKFNLKSLIECFEDLKNQLTQIYGVFFEEDVYGK